MCYDLAITSTFFSGINEMSHIHCAMYRNLERQIQKEDWNVVELWILGKKEGTIALRWLDSFSLSELRSDQKSMILFLAFRGDLIFKEIFLHSLKK